MSFSFSHQVSNHVCSDTTAYHYLFDASEEVRRSILEQGLLPLSSFPDSPRWQEGSGQGPSFYAELYREFFAPVFQREAPHSGIFFTPINFRRLPGSYLFDHPRVAIPIDRFDPAWTCITWEDEGTRVVAPISAETMHRVVAEWDEARVRHWFGRDPHKMFFHVPQIACYQPGGVRVEPRDLDERPTGGR